MVDQRGYHGIECEKPDPYPVFRIASQVPLRSGCVLKFENQGGGEIKVGAWLI